MKRLLRLISDDSVKLNLIWRLTLGAAGYMLALYGVLWGLGAAFGVLFAAWGLTSSNLAYAPVWAQQIVLWHTDFTYALAYGLSLLAAVRISGRPKKRFSGRHAALGAALGAGLGAALTVLSLLADSMRLEWPLNEPALSLRHASAFVVLMLGSLSSEALTKRIMFDPLSGRFGRWAGYASAAVLTVLLTGVWTNPVSLVSAALMSLVGCALYERGGMIASAALTAGWTAWTAWLFAWPGKSAVSVYQMYAVSDAWLTGGNAGANAGLGAAIGWLIMAAVLLRGAVRILKERITNGKDSHCNRRSGLPRREHLWSGAAGDEGSRRGRRAG